jgi:multidrug efflux pump subunit AcrA (membrane-fusion protein)
VNYHFLRVFIILIFLFRIFDIALPEKVFCDDPLNPVISLAEEELSDDTLNLSYENNDIAFIGVTEAVNDVIIGLAVSGTIDKIYFQIGDRVKANTPILHLKKRKEELELTLRKLLWENKARLDITKMVVL